MYAQFSPVSTGTWYKFPSKKSCYSKNNNCLEEVTDLKKLLFQKRDSSEEIATR